MKRRTHGRRSVIARISRTRAAVKRAMDRTIEREAIMCLAHALLALQHAKKFILEAERITAKTL